MTEPRPEPDITHPDFAPFWAATRQHRLVVMACADCGGRRWPPRPLCRVCGSASREWVEVDGAGVLYSWTTVGRASLPGFAADVPYTVAVGELVADSSIRLLATLEHAETVELQVGLPLQIAFQDRSDATLPIWRPAEVSGA